MSEFTDVDLFDPAPLEELSDDELRVRAELLRAYEAMLRQRLREELARRSALVRGRRSRLRCQRPRDG